MQMQIPLKRALQSAIVIAFILVTVMIWPGKIIHGWHTEGQVCEDSQTIFLNEGAISQSFIPENDDLTFIDFYIYNEEQPEQGALIVRIFDEKNTLLIEKEFPVSSLKIPGTCRVRVENLVNKGMNYYFTIENADAELLYSFSDGVNLDVAYEYKEYFPNLFCIVIWGLTLVLCVVLFVLVEKLFKKNEIQVKYDFGIRLVLAACTIIITLFGVINVFPLKSFTTDHVNILILELGIFLFCAYALYGLLYHRTCDNKKIDWLAKLPKIIQTLAFTGVMLGGVRYLNALYSFHQYSAVRTVLIYFAIAIICSYSKKELLNLYNGIYLVGALVWGFFHCKAVFGEEEAFILARGDSLIVLLWGIIIINTIILLVKRKWNKISIAYLLAFVLLAAEMIRSRHEKTWPIVLAVCFGLFAVRVICNGKVSQYLQCFVNGTFIHFVGICVYAMLYRPFHFYTHVRYSGVFHTVTMSAVYYTFVLILAVTKFLIVYHESKSLKAVWKEIGMIGLSSSFLLLTVSRTGIYSAVIVCIALFIFTAIFIFKDGLLSLLKRVFIVVVTSVAFFLISFTACRIIPAVVSEPYTYDIEWFQDSIKASEEWNSFRYITIQKFFDVADAKIGYYLDPDKVVNPPKVENPENSVSSGDSVYITEDKKGLGASTDYTNGRLDIYKRYLNALDWVGHDKVTIDYVEDGMQKSTGHAHSVFLQMPYDFGIGVGIYFILFCILTGIMSLKYYFNHKDENTALFPIAVIATFGMCGLVEWVFIPYIPTGFAFLFIIILLIPKQKKGSYEKNV